LFPPAKDIQRLPFDACTAQALMVQAPLPDGFEAVLDCPDRGFTNDREICDRVKRMLSRLEIKVTPNDLTRDKFQAKVLACERTDGSDLRNSQALTRERPELFKTNMDH
jgi:hypothetical protein